MTTYPSTVMAGGDPNLGELFPTILPEPERYVYEYVLEATQSGGILLSENDEAASQVVPAVFAQPAHLGLYANRAGAPIPVVRGWPAYPGVVPMIGVAVGPDSTDEQHEQLDGGFAGQVFHHDQAGNLVATADYYSEPLYSTVVVELIHENRDERDRLHNELRRLLFPLRRKLTYRDGQIRKVRVDGEKQELPMDEQPFVIYVSVFTVHVYYEMLEAVNVTGANGVIASIGVALHPGVTGPPLAVELPVAPPPSGGTDPILTTPVFPYPES